MKVNSDSYIKSEAGCENESLCSIVKTTITLTHVPPARALTAIYSRAYKFKFKFMLEITSIAQHAINKVGLSIICTLD